jgi:hypothetical protein
LRVDTPHVGLHDHGEQGPVDAPAPLEEGGEEAAGSQLGDPQLDVPGGGRQDPGPVAVALGAAALGPLVGAGADHRRGLGFDQLLEDPLQARANGVGQLAGLQRGE